MQHWTEFLDSDGADGAYLPWKKVEPRVGISRTTAWRLQKSGDFPRPYVVSPGRVAYRESEVEAWKVSRGHRAGEFRPRGAPASVSPQNQLALAPEPVTWTASDEQVSEPAPSVAAQAAKQKRPARRKQDPQGSAQMRFEF